MLAIVPDVPVTVVLEKRLEKAASVELCRL
jgi:hypothetical protein